jgi:hypothetical protein
VIEEDLVSFIEYELYINENLAVAMRSVCAQPPSGCLEKRAPFS